MNKPTTPKWRPVFGEKLSPGSTPPTNVPHQTSTTEAPAKTASAQKKVEPVSGPVYFATMDSIERIIFASTVYRQPKDWSLNEFSSYNAGSFSFLDKDLPGLAYLDIVKLLTKWTKVGLLEAGRYSKTYSLKEGVAEAYWQWLNEQITPKGLEFEPEKIYPSELPSTLDNMLNFLVMVDQGEVLVTQNQEINKHSLKRVLASLFEPIRAPKIFTSESYFFWLLGVVQFLKLIVINGDRLVLTTLGRELPKSIQVADLVCKIYPIHFRFILNKGFFLVLPVLDRCTSWTSWTQLVNDLIPADNVGNSLRQDRVFSLLDPMRFLGLLDWGEYQNEILVRTTPLGQFLIPKLLRGQNLAEYGRKIKTLTDQVYPMEGPNIAYVQPNFEILVPHSASWTVRWELGQFAVLEQQDQMLKYRLDKIHLMNALKRGMSAGNVLNLFTKLSPYPLPENLVLTIQQWVENFGQVAFMQLSLLECTTPEQAASIASARKYREYVYGLYSPTTVIVRETDKLRKLLEKQGIYPLPGILGGEEAAQRKGS